MKKDGKQKSIEQNRERDYVTNKLLLVFTLAFAMLLFFMNISRMMKSTTSFILARNITYGVAWAAVVAFLVGIVMIVRGRKIGSEKKYRLFCGKNITVAAVFVAICVWALALVFSQSMLMLLYVFVPSVVVLYIIYYSYPREFFMIALASAASGIGIWLVGSELVNTSGVLVLAISGAVVLLLAAFTVWANICGGSIRIFGREFVPFKNDARYAIVYLTYVLALMLLVAAFLVSDLVMYFVLGIVAYLVLIGVYYTVKLI